MSIKKHGRVHILGDSRRLFKMAQDEITWDDAIVSGKFVKLVAEEPKKLKLGVWGFQEVEKFGDKKVEFEAEVLEEDGEVMTDKVFTTTSARLKKKLRPIFENRDKAKSVTISIIMIGEGFDTQYSVKEVK